MVKYNFLKYLFKNITTKSNGFNAAVSESLCFCCSFPFSTPWLHLAHPFLLSASVLLTCHRHCVSLSSYFPLSWIPFTSVTHTNTFRHIWKFKCTFCLWDKHAVFFFWIWFASINIIISISIHFCFYKCRGFTFPENWVKFCWVYVPCFLYLCISWWISGLVPFPSYCE